MPQPQRGRNELDQLAEAFLPDNPTSAITPLAVRTVLEADRYAGLNLADDGVPSTGNPAPGPQPLRVQFSVGAFNVVAGQGLPFSGAITGGTAPFEHTVTAKNLRTNAVTQLAKTAGPTVVGVWPTPSGTDTYDIVDVVTDATSTAQSITRRVYVQVTAGVPAVPTNQQPGGPFFVKYIHTEEGLGGGLLSINQGLLCIGAVATVEYALQDGVTYHNQRYYISFDGSNSPQLQVYLNGDFTGSLVGGKWVREGSEFDAGRFEAISANQYGTGHPKADTLMQALEYLYTHLGAGGTPAKLATPTQLQQISRTSDTATFVWNAAPNATGYNFKVGSTVYPLGNVASYTLTGLQPSTVPTAQVQALYGPDRSRDSDYSALATGTAYAGGVITPGTTVGSPGILVFTTTAYS